MIKVNICFQAIFFYRRFHESREPMLYNTGLLVTKGLLRGLRVKSAVLLALSIVAVKDCLMMLSPFVFLHTALSIHGV
jgi:hypothetical protein